MKLSLKIMLCLFLIFFFLGYIGSLLEQDNESQLSEFNYGGHCSWRSEEILKQSLKCPSTYDKIALDYGWCLECSKKDSILIVDITYDAQNSFGAPIRSTRGFKWKCKNEKVIFMNSFER